MSLFFKVKKKYRDERLVKPHLGYFFSHAPTFLDIMSDTEYPNYFPQTPDFCQITTNDIGRLGNQFFEYVYQEHICFLMKKLNPFIVKSLLQFMKNIHTFKHLIIIFKVESRS